MSKLKDRLTKARNEFYKTLVPVIVSNPDKSYARIACEYGLSEWAIRQAVRVGGIKRQRGQASPAYPRKRL